MTRGARISMRAATVLVVIAALQGCAVLTKSQVKAVQEFSQAATQYTALPGELVESYGTLLRNKQLLSLTRRDLGGRDSGTIDPKAANQAWDRIKEAYALERDLDDIAKQMDAALEIAQAYSQLLSTVANDDYTSSASEAAVHLGNALDKSTNAYNSTYQPANPIKAVGGAIGRIVRTTTGIFIRQRQAKVLQQCLVEAEPAVQALMAEVEVIALEKMRPAFVNFEENFLGSEFRAIAVRNRTVPLELVRAVYEDFARAREGQRLAEHVAAAAKAFRSAHSELLTKTRRREGLDGTLEQVRALRAEIKAGKAAAKEISE